MAGTVIYEKPALLAHVEFDAGASRIAAISAHRVLLVHVVAVALVLLIDFVLQSPSITLIAGGAIVMVAYAAMGVMELRRAPLLFSPLSFYFFWYAVGLGASAIYIGNLLVSDQSVSFSVFDVWREEVAAGYLIFLSGSLCLHLGIQIFRPLAPLPGERSGERRTANTVRLAPIGFAYLLGIVYLLRPGPFAPLGSLAGPLGYAGLSALCAFALSEPESMGMSNASFAGILTAASVGLFVANLNTGSKARIMFSLLPVIWLFMTRRSLRRALPIVIAGGMLLYSGVYQVVTLARTLPADQSEDSMSLIFRAYDQLSSGQAQSGSVADEGFSDQMYAFLMRQFDPLPVGFLVQEVRERGLMYGKTMAYALYAWVPRVLWPEKPIVSHGTWFTTYLGFARDPSVATTSTGESAIGELYWNFGMPGVFGGMLLIGALIGILWRMAGADPHSEAARMLLYMIIMMEIPDQAEAVTYTMGLIADLLIFWTIFAASEIVRWILVRGNAGIAQA